VVCDAATIKYVKLAHEWRQRAESCPYDEERKIFLSIADGYEQLASLSENPDRAGYYVEEAAVIWPV
jgi:hypothetical protein